MPRSYRRARAAATLLALTLLLPAASSALAWTQSEDARLVHDAPQELDWFGHDVAIDGGTLAVAVAGDVPSPYPWVPRGGSVFVYVRDGDGWAFQARLVADDIDVVHSSPASLDVSGDTIVFGSPRTDATGAAYVFERHGTTWTQHAKVTAGDASEGDRFGESIAIDGNTLVVGAPWADDAEPDAGAAYVFARRGNAWREQARLVEPEPETRAHYGQSVDVSGQTVVVGVPWDDEVADASGSVFVYGRHGNAWEREARLSALDVRGNNLYGWSVAIDGDTVVAGAIFAGGPARFTGVAYVHQRVLGTWVPQGRLVALDGEEGDYFGVSVAIDGDDVVVGATESDGTQSKPGSAYLFHRDAGTWVPGHRLAASDGAAADALGWSVSVDGGVAAVGAPRTDHVEVDAGTVYVFGVERDGLP